MSFQPKVTSTSKKCQGGRLVRLILPGQGQGQDHQPINTVEQLTCAILPFKEKEEFECVRFSNGRSCFLIPKEDKDESMIICESPLVSYVHAIINYSYVLDYDITKSFDPPKELAHCLMDMLSKNGTFLNGERVGNHKSRKLNFGDIISLGFSHRNGDSDDRLGDPANFVFKYLAYFGEEEEEGESTVIISFDAEEKMEIERKEGVDEPRPSTSSNVHNLFADVTMTPVCGTSPLVEGRTTRQSSNRSNTSTSTSTLPSASDAVAKKQRNKEPDLKDNQKLARPILKLIYSFDDGADDDEDDDAVSENEENLQIFVAELNSLIGQLVDVDINLFTTNFLLEYGTPDFRFPDKPSHKLLLYYLQNNVKFDNIAKFKLTLTLCSAFEFPLWNLIWRKLANNALDLQELELELHAHPTYPPDFLFIYDSANQVLKLKFEVKLHTFCDCSPNNPNLLKHDSSVLPSLQRFTSNLAAGLPNLQVLEMPLTLEPSLFRTLLHRRWDSLEKLIVGPLDEQEVEYFSQLQSLLQMSCLLKQVKLPRLPLAKVVVLLQNILKHWATSLEELELDVSQKDGEAKRLDLMFPCFPKLRKLKIFHETSDTFCRIVFCGEDFGVAEEVLYSTHFPALEEIGLLPCAGMNQVNSRGGWQFLDSFIPRSANVKPQVCETLKKLIMPEVKQFLDDKVDNSDRLEQYYNDVSKLFPNAYVDVWNL